MFQAVTGNGEYLQSYSLKIWEKEKKSTSENVLHVIEGSENQKKSCDINHLDHRNPWL
jgi:hypothetical protein